MNDKDSYQVSCIVYEPSSHEHRLGPLHRGMAVKKKKRMMMMMVMIMMMMMMVVVVVVILILVLVLIWWKTVVLEKAWWIKWFLDKVIKYYCSYNHQVSNMGGFPKDRAKRMTTK